MASALVRIPRDTMILNEPQESIVQRGTRLDKIPLPNPDLTGPLTPDLPTPRPNPNTNRVPSPVSSDSPSDDSSTWSHRSSRSDFDELYDVTDSEDSDTDWPLHLSDSVKRHVAALSSSSTSSARDRQRPSLVIPSPSEWPTIQKCQAAARLNATALRVPSTRSTPSLDESTSGDDAASLSCPSTPDNGRRDHDDLWDCPVQLDPSSISLLQHIHGETRLVPMDPLVEVPEEAPPTCEMKEVGDSMRSRIHIDTTMPRPPSLVDHEFSALSVPSPGGFFASLESSVARNAWTGKVSTPTTSTAAKFYGVPFRPDSPPPPVPALPADLAAGNTRPDDPIEQIVTPGSPAAPPGPPTATRIVFSPTRLVFSPTELVGEVDEIDETYDNTLQQTARVNIGRTRGWLDAQNAYMDAVCADETDLSDAFAHVADVVPHTPENRSPVSSDVSPGKKSVRFAEFVETAAESGQGQVKRISPIHDGTFWEGWRRQKRSQRARDVFHHAQARAEADHVRRRVCPQQHLDQLQGRYEIPTAMRPAPSRPISNFLLPDGKEPEPDDRSVQVERQRQALEILAPSAWHLSAQRKIHGGRLLTSPIVASFKHRADIAVLDLAGASVCGWAWDVAMEHPKARVITTVSTDAEAHVGACAAGPANHSVVAAPKPWDLPFSDASFDVVSARSLHTQLRTHVPAGTAGSSDEWDLVLAACRRVLKPGGFLEFNLLDAELVHADPAAQAAGVEFAFNLRTRGYDPAPGKTFLPRLKRAGFAGVKRAWLVLPAAHVLPRWTDAGKTKPSSSSSGTAAAAPPVPDASPHRLVAPAPDGNGLTAVPLGSTTDVRAVTGLMGARLWEEWMVKLQGEIDGEGGAGVQRALEGMARALGESGANGKAGWRYLVGWARKE